MKSDCESDGDDVEQNNLQGALVVRKSKISWSDVAGLDSVKGILKEAVTLQTKNPQGILLFGVSNRGNFHQQI